MSKVTLVADIGGTNSRFAVFVLENNETKLVHSAWLRTTEFNSFGELLIACKDSELSPLLSNLDTCVIAAAGPVQDHEFCDPPNIPWTLSTKELKEAFPPANSFLINDFLAQAYAVDTPLMKKAKLIKGGDDESGMIGILGPGTGLGKAMLCRDMSVPFALASEGGHAAAVSVSKREQEYFSFVSRQLSERYPSWEQVVNGKSVELLHSFLTKESLDITSIASLMKKGECPELVEMYSILFARMCRCFSLEVYSEGGLVITGGVLAKTPELIDLGVFNKEFLDSSTQKGFLERVKVSHLSNEDSGLWGAARFGNIKSSR